MFVALARIERQQFKEVFRFVCGERYSEYRGGSTCLLHWASFTSVKLPHTPQSALLRARGVFYFVSDKYNFTKTSIFAQFSDRCSLHGISL